MLIVANWKANKTLEEAISWLDNLNLEDNSSHEIVLAAPTPYLVTLRKAIDEKKKELVLAAQNVSNFPNGQYTGEVTAKMLSGITKYCIVGHSERRRIFGETAGDVQKKCTELLENNIKPIICASSLEELPDNLRSLESGSYVLAFEPTEAISVNGVYQEYDYQKADLVMSSWKNELGKDVKILFGGSVNKENIGEISKITALNGLLVGNASLDVAHFTEIINSLQI